MDWIKKQAKLYRNLALTDRYLAVVHLEDKEDESFWNEQLQHVRGGRYRYLYYSKNNDGNDTRGCEQCLRFRPYLSERFFICIDSDLRLLKSEEGLTSENHIAQTYTYSWENHQCEATHLCKRINSKLGSSDFDFESFMTLFSKIVYKPLLYLVYYSRDSKLNSLWNVSKFNACIPLQPNRNDLKDNGRLYLEEVKRRFDVALKGLKEKPDAVECLTESNAYLHVQGHQLFKLVLHIGTLLCKGKNVAFRTDILENGVNTEGYDEIVFLQKDLKEILKNV